MQKEIPQTDVFESDETLHLSADNTYYTLFEFYFWKTIIFKKLDDKVILNVRRLI